MQAWNAATHCDTGDGYFLKFYPDKMPPILGGSQMRYYGDRVETVKEKLSDSAVSVIKELGFGPFLAISLPKLVSHSKVLAEWIAFHCKPAKYKNENVIVFGLDPKSPRLITAEVLEIIYGLSRGTAAVPQHILDWPNATQNDLYHAFCAANNGNKIRDYLAAAEACSAAKEVGDTKLEVRLFLASVLSFALFTSNSNYISAANIECVLDTKKIAASDWCKLLIDHMIEGFKRLLTSRSVTSPMSFLIFFLDNLDINEITMDTPRFQHVTGKQVENALDWLKKGCKLKKWENTVYGSKGIPEVRPEEITYITISKKELIDKKRPRSHQTYDAKEDKTGNDLLKDCNKGLYPFQEEDDDDIFVRVPSLKKLVAPSLEQLPTDMATNAKVIIEQCQSSWLQCIQETTETHITDCAAKLQNLFQPQIITYGRKSKPPQLPENQFYEENVLSRKDMRKEDGQRTFKSLGTFDISEYNFVDIFKPEGWMSNWVVQALANIWNAEWAGEKVILDLSAVKYSIGGDKARLLHELDKKIQLGHTKLIFLPILYDRHWLSVAFDLEKKYKIILDSMETPAHKDEAQRVVSTVDEYFKPLEDSEFKYNEDLTVKQQCNGYDCGFYMLWFIRTMAEGGNIENVDEKTITQYRRKLAYSIYCCNEDTNISDLISEETDSTGVEESEGHYIGEMENGDSDGGVSPNEVRNTASDANVEEDNVEETKKRGRKKLYVEATILPCDVLLPRIQSSEIESPLRVYDRPEPNPDTALKFMKHIFDTYDNDSKILIDDGHNVSFSGQTITEQFRAADLEPEYLMFFIHCLRRDDILYRPKSLGYRVIIEPPVLEALAQNNFETATEEIARLYKAKEFESAHHIFVPLFHSKRWVLYVINFRNKQINILDPMERTFEANKSWHAAPSKVIAKLYDKLKSFTASKIENFSNYRRTFIDVPKEKLKADTAYHVMIYLERYNADTNALEYDINALKYEHLERSGGLTATSQRLRANSLCYMISSRENQAQLPEDVKKLLPPPNPLIEGRREQASSKWTF